MSAAAEAVLSTLRGLPRGVVDDVRKRINAYLQFGAWNGEAAAADPALPEGRRVFRVLSEEMAAAGLADPDELHYSRMKQRADFDRRAGKLVAFLREQSGDRLVQDAILRIGLQLLIAHFQRFAADTESFILTVDVLARNVEKVPARLDREFPGYGACGMLHLLAMPRT